MFGNFRQPACWTVLLALAAASATARDDLEADFRDPPARWKTRPLWFWNAPPDRERTERMMEQCRDAGYFGFGILPTKQTGLKFMGPEYLDRYREAVDKAAELGVKMCLYDDLWFPSGAAGGLLAEKYPEALGKRLDMEAEDFTGPKRIERPLPAGKLMAAVAAELGGQRCLDLGANVSQGWLRSDVPEGQWKVMLFTCVSDGAKGLVDYLDPDAVKRFIELTYQKYYETFPRHFGKTIDSAFYDEPTFHWLQGGRAWTPRFNDEFRRRHGRSPALLYPALWMDIGPETAAARNALFGLRAELFAEGFVKTLADWCDAHGIELTGHMDQEEVVNPVGLCGDLIKVFKYQPVPGIDQVFRYGRASRAYKIVSSAAVNYGRSHVMCESYGGMKLPRENLYKEAMDQFAKGINVMVPHAVWYGSQGVAFPPELSPHNATYGPELPAYNRYLGRLQRVLQHGRPVVDVAVLYPIASLQAGYRFGVGKAYEGGVIPAEADYMQVGEHLMLGARCDFTFLHPDTLDEKCAVDGPTIRLDQPRTNQRYRLLVLPGSTTIHLSNLRKIKRFHDNGGAVIATTRLPTQSAEFGKDREVQEIVAAMFGGARGEPVPATNASGQAQFVAVPDLKSLRAALAKALPTPDVIWKHPPEVIQGNLSYLHKFLDGRDVFFFANSSETTIDTEIRLRGTFTPQWWDPHTGDIAAAEFTREEVAGQPYTRLRLRLPPVRSVLVVGAPADLRQ